MLSGLSFEVLNYLTIVRSSCAERKLVFTSLCVQFSDQLFKRQIGETRFVAHVIVQCLMRSSSCDVQNIFPIIDQLANLIDIYSLEVVDLSTGFLAIITYFRAKIHLQPSGQP